MHWKSSKKYFPIYILSLFCFHFLIKSSRVCTCAYPFLHPIKDGSPDFPQKWWFWKITLIWAGFLTTSLKGALTGGTNPPFLFAKSKVLLCTNQTKKTASKNIDFWRSYGHLKLPFFDGQKKRSIRANLICDVIAGTFFRNYQFLCFDQCE